MNNRNEKISREDINVAYLEKLFGRIRTLLAPISGNQKFKKEFDLGYFNQIPEDVESSLPLELERECLSVYSTALNRLDQCLKTNVLKNNKELKVTVKLFLIDELKKCEAISGLSQEATINDLDIDEKIENARIHIGTAANFLSAEHQELCVNWRVAGVDLLTYHYPIWTEKAINGKWDEKLDGNHYNHVYLDIFDILQNKKREKAVEDEKKIFTEMNLIKYFSLYILKYADRSFREDLDGKVVVGGILATNKNPEIRISEAHENNIKNKILTPLKDNFSSQLTSQLIDKFQSNAKIIWAHANLLKQSHKIEFSSDGLIQIISLSKEAPIPATNNELLSTEKNEKNTDGGPDNNSTVAIQSSRPTGASDGNTISVHSAPELKPVPPTPAKSSWIDPETAIFIAVGIAIFTIGIAVAIATSGGAVPFMVGAAVLTGLHVAGGAAATTAIGWGLLLTASAAIGAFFGWGAKKVVVDTSLNENPKKLEKPESTSNLTLAPTPSEQERNAAIEPNPKKVSSPINIPSSGQVVTNANSNNTNSRSNQTEVKKRNSSNNGSYDVRLFSVSLSPPEKSELKPENRDQVKPDGNTPKKSK